MPVVKTWLFSVIRSECFPRRNAFAMLKPTLTPITYRYQGRDFQLTDVDGKGVKALLA